MTTSVRYSQLTNTTGALITNPDITYGQDWATQVIEKTFAAAEIGTGRGQTRDAVNGKKGFLLAKFYGPSIQIVGPAELMKQATVANSDLTYFYRVTAVADFNVAVAAALDTSVKGVTSLYILDTGTDGSVNIATGDKVLITVAIGTKP